jgi:hypothetical protein
MLVPISNEFGLDTPQQYSVPKKRATISGNNVGFSFHSNISSKSQVRCEHPSLAC